MCGIAGIIGNFKKAYGDAIVDQMLQQIIHRGPDSNGKWSTDDFAFGMQRLSIIDIVGGDQPIWSNTGIGIVFNGEIYNFKKIRFDLEKDGIAFKTHCDTEVILNLYLKKGINAIHDLEGMFAICIYDPIIQKVYLIRDRLGVKPLYYYSFENTFIFSSEIKALIAVLDQTPSINEEAIWDYLTLRYVPSPQTIWHNITKLEPGNYLEYDIHNENFNIVKYWSVEFLSKKINKLRNYEKEFENLFLEAVEKRLLASDVPVGIMLSGGLDSSCVAAAAVELGHKNFHTFSVGFNDPNAINELPFAEQVAKQLQSQHHEITVSKKNFLDFISDFVYYTDEPLADLASIPLYYLSILAKEHVKVVLSGEGADEVLAGYNLDNTAKHLCTLNVLKYLPKCVLNNLPSNSLKILSKHGYSNFLKVQSTHITNVFNQSLKQKIWNKELQQPTEEKIRSWYELTKSKEPLDQLQQAYCHSWLVEDLLMKADKMTMATSLELRVPFLDHKLVEWAAKLPLALKVGDFKNGFITKKILRNFASKRLPQNIINRPKQGFPVPAYSWMQNDLHLWAKSILDNSSIFEYINKNAINTIFKQAEHGSKEAPHQLWSLVILASWLKRWSV